MGATAAPRFGVLASQSNVIIQNVVDVMWWRCTLLLASTHGVRVLAQFERNYCTSGTLRIKKVS